MSNGALLFIITWFFIYTNVSLTSSINSNSAKNVLECDEINGVISYDNIEDLKIDNEKVSFVDKKGTKISISNAKCELKKHF